MKRDQLILTLITLLILANLSSPSFGNAEIFLEQHMGTRAMGMGGAFVGVGDSIDAVFLNPAGLCAQEKFSFSTMQANNFLDVNNSYAALVYPVSGHGTLGAGAIISKVSDLTYRDNEGNQLGNFNWEEGAYYLSYGTKISDRLMLGASMDLISNQMLDQKDTTMGVDIGILYNINDKTTLGGTIVNVNEPTLGLDTVRRVYKIGVGYKLNSMLLTVQADFKAASSAQLKYGIEYQFASIMRLRAGNDSKNYTMGIGLLLGKIGLDYAFSPHELGNQNLFSIVIYPY